MKIGIIGNYGATNVGDDAILSVLLRDLSGHEVAVFSANPNDTAARFGVGVAPLFPLGFRSLFRVGFSSSFRTLKQMDAVVLGGGGLFQDDHLYACFLWAWQVFWASLLKKPLFIYTCGVGPLRTRIGKWLTAWSYKKAAIITVRDAKSKEVLVGIGLPPESVHLTADPVFSAEIGGFAHGSVPAGASSAPAGGEIIMVSLRPWLHHNQNIITSFTEFLAELKRDSATIIFVSMQEIQEKDSLVIDSVRRAVGGELFVPRNFDELVARMRHATCAIGMRYHFLIAAMMAGTPVLPVSYGPKVDELFNGTPLWKYRVGVGELSEKALLSAFMVLKANLPEAKDQMASRLDDLRALSSQNHALLERFLGSLSIKN